MNLVKCNCPCKELLCNQPNSLKASTLYYVNTMVIILLCYVNNIEVSHYVKKKKEN